jgi:hypothetical protein
MAHCPICDKPYSSGEKHVKKCFESYTASLKHSINADWIDRCKSFRAKDAEKAEADNADLRQARLELIEAAKQSALDRDKAEQESAALRQRLARLVEAAEKGLDALTTASRELTQEHKIVLKGRRWGQSSIEDLNKAIAAAKDAK